MTRPAEPGALAAVEAMVPRRRSGACGESSVQTLRRWAVSLTRGWAGAGAGRAGRAGVCALCACLWGARGPTRAVAGAAAYHEQAAAAAAEEESFGAKKGQVESCFLSHGRHVAPPAGAGTVMAEKSWLDAVVKRASCRYALHQGHVSVQKRRRKKEEGEGTIAAVVFHGPRPEQPAEPPRARRSSGRIGDQRGFEPRDTGAHRGRGDERWPARPTPAPLLAGGGLKSFNHRM